jgi:hypothetical protein
MSILAAIGGLLVGVVLTVVAVTSINPCGGFLFP